MKYLLLLLICLPQILLAQVSSNPYILVTGTGQASAAPDMANISIGVFAKNNSAKLAMQEISKLSNQLLAVSKNFKISEKDIQTSNLSMGQDYSQEKVITYIASSNVTVTIKDLSQLGDFLAAAVDNGANNIQNIQFLGSDTLNSYKTARQKAFDDAKSKALQLAELSNKKLGDVLSVEEGLSSSIDPFQPYRMAKQEISSLAISSPTISSGQLDYSVTLSVRFLIN